MPFPRLARAGKAVQTLSRLNRAHPLKHDTFVLDFVNDADTIQAGFEPYYRTAILSEATDPNRLHDLQSALDARQVYAWPAVESFVRSYLDGADRDWVNRRQTPQPAGVYQDRLDFDAARIATLPRTFIDCTAPALPTIAVMRERVRREPGWQVVELATGHDPMISAPEALVKLLLDCTR